MVLKIKEKAEWKKRRERWKRLRRSSDTITTGDSGDAGGGKPAGRAERTGLFLPFFSSKFYAHKRRSGELRAGAVLAQLLIGEFFSFDHTSG